MPSWRMFGPRRPHPVESIRDDQNDQDDLELEELQSWNHTAGMADTRFWVVARRLPSFIWQAVRLAWQANPRDTALALACQIVAGILTAFGLLATQDVLSALFAAGPTADRVWAALPALGVVAAAISLRSGLGMLAGWAQARLEPRAERLIFARLFDVATKVELAVFDDPAFADELNRARFRGVLGAQSLLRVTMDWVTGALGLVAVGGALTVLHPVLLPVLVLASLPLGWATVRAARVQYDSIFARAARQRRLWTLRELMSARETAAELRSYGMRQLLLDEHDTVMRAETRSELEVVRAQTRSRLIGGILSGVAAVGVYALLGALLLAGWIPLATAGAAVFALQAGRTALQQFVHSANGVYEEGLYYTDFVSFCDGARAHIPRPRRHAHLARPDTVELRNLGFRYPGMDRWAVRNVTLTIQRGQTIALVGENGSGKSSLAKVLAGLYPPDEGAVRWDGVDTRDADPGAVRDHVAVVPQDWWKWPLTAGQNITMGRHQRHHRDDAVTAAARDAGAHDMIADLPAGYRTLLDRTFKGGRDLSGGQWQRLVAARGFYRDAGLLICDEPSSALDARAEHFLFEQLRAHGADRMVVLITHRLANVRHADRIYVLDGGRVVEEGGHAELMARNGRYAELFTLQSSGYLADEHRQVAGGSPTA